MPDVIWKGKPALKPYLVKSFTEFLAAGLFIVFCFVVFYIIQNTSNGKTNSWVLYGFTIFVILQGIFLFIKRLIEYRRLEYQITSNSIIIITQFVSKNIKIIDRNKIQIIDVKRNIIDRLFKVYTIYFYSGQLSKGYEDRLRKELDKFEFISDSSDIIKYLEDK